MLVEFSVENYRSFQERQTFSMVASEDETMLESNSFPMPGAKNLRLLTSNVIYGPNASGKSNLLRALQELKNIVVNSASKMQLGDRFDVEPFLLNTNYQKRPTCFEIVFVCNRIRYEYGLNLDKKRVHEEWLLAYPKGRPQTWFSRTYDPKNPELKSDEGYKWNFGSGLKGEKERIKKFVRSNSLFLSHAAQNNHPQLTEVFEWLTKYFAYLMGIKLKSVRKQQRLQVSIPILKLIRSYPFRVLNFGSCCTIVTPAALSVNVSKS
jgi:hypothetical protein